MKHSGMNQGQKGKKLGMGMLLKAFVLGLLVVGNISISNAQLVYLNGRGANNERVIPAGKGQEYEAGFTFVKSFYFVQFAVYSSNTERSKMRAPKVSEQVWLIEHFNTKIQGSEWDGAYYIVKPCRSESEARAYVEACKKQGINCWYNPELSNIDFTLHGLSH